MIYSLRRPATHHAARCAPTRVFGTRVATQCPHAIHVLPYIIDFHRSNAFKNMEKLHPVYYHILSISDVRNDEKDLLKHTKNFPNAFWPGT